MALSQSRLISIRLWGLTVSLLAIPTSNAWLTVFFGAFGEWFWYRIAYYGIIYVLAFIVIQLGGVLAIGGLIRWREQYFLMPRRVQVGVVTASAVIVAIIEIVLPRVFGVLF